MQDGEVWIDGWPEDKCGSARECTWEGGLQGGSCDTSAGQVSRLPDKGEHGLVESEAELSLTLEANLRTPSVTVA